MEIRYLKFKKISFIEAVYFKGNNIIYPLHNHTSVVTIGLVITGNLLLQMKNKKIVSDYFIVYPYEPHSVIINSKCEMITFCIKKEYLKEFYINFLSIIKEIGIGLKFQGINLEGQTVKIRNAVSKLYQNLNFDKVFNIKYIEESKTEIENFPEEDISVKKLACKKYIDKDYFIRQFKSIVGLTPRQFQIQKRIRKAQKLIEKNISLTKIAVESGFYDQSHFIRYFKKVVRITPGKYKKSVILI